MNKLCDEYNSVFEDIYGKMKLIRGKAHDYLGMILDNSEKVKVKITIMDYIREILECVDKSEPKYSGTKSSTAPMNLFVVDEDCEKISK